jgi:anthranilate synthase component 2
MPSPRILAIDNYDSFTFTLVDYLKSLGASVLVKQNDAMSAQDALGLVVDGFLISPGPGVPEDAGMSVELARGCIDTNRPLLGICLGHQAIVQACDQTIDRVAPMHGKIAKVEHNGEGLLAHVPSPFSAARYHSLAATRLVRPLIPYAWSDDGVVMAIRHETAPVHGIQFHPESIATEHGHQMLKTFLLACA